MARNANCDPRAARSRAHVGRVKSLPALRGARKIASRLEAIHVRIGWLRHVIASYCERFYVAAIAERNSNGFGLNGRRRLISGGAAAADSRGLSRPFRDDFQLFSGCKFSIGGVQTYTTI